MKKQNAIAFFQNLKIFLALLIASSLVLSSFVCVNAGSAKADNNKDETTLNFQTSQTSTLWQLGIARPTIKENSGITHDAFISRLLVYFQRESSVRAKFLDKYFEIGKTREQAAQENCDYLLILNLSDNNERTTTDTLKKNIPIFGKKIGRKDYKIEVDYSVEWVKTKQQIFNGKVKGEDKETEKAINEVMEQLRTSVSAKIKEHATQNNVIGSAKDLEDDDKTKSDTATTATTPAPDTSGKPSKNPQRLVVQTMHDQFVTNFSYSPDNNLLATLGADGVVKVWLVETGQEIISFPGYQIAGIDFSPDNKTIAAVSKSGVVRLFDIASGKYETLTPLRFDDNTSAKPKEDDVLTAYTLFPQPIPVTFNKTGDLLVTGDIQGIKIWDIKNKTVKQNFQSNKEIIRLALSNDGRLVAGVYEEGEGREDKIKIWEIETGKELADKSYKPKVEVVTALAFSKDDKLLVCGSGYGSIKVYDLTTKKGTDIFVSKEDKDYANVSIFERVARIGKYVIPALALIELIGGALSRIRLLNFQKKSIRSLDLAPDNNTLAYNLGDSSIHIMSLSSKTELRTIPENFSPKDLDEDSKFFRALCPISFSTDGRIINTCSEFRSVLRYEAATGKTLSSIAVARRGINIIKDPRKGDAYNVLSVPRATTSRFLNENTLLTATYSGGLRFWDLERNSKPQTLVEDDALSIGNKTPVSMDGRYYASLTNDSKTLLVKELLSKKEKQRFDTNVQIISFAFSPDGRYIAVQYAEEKKRAKILTFFYINLKVFEIESRKEVFSSNKNWINQFDFSPDGKKFLYLPKSKSSIFAQMYLNAGEFKANTDAKILDTSTWQEVQKIKVEQSLSTGFAPKLVFSPDGTMVGGEDKDEMKIWDANTGQVIHRTRLPQNVDVSNLAFAPKRTLLTFSIYKTLYNWEYGKNIVGQFPTGTDFWGTLSYSPEGTVLALGGVESKVRLFNMDKEVETGYLVDPAGEEWMTVTPDGRFDSGELDDIKEVHWIMPYAIYKPQPVEAFMRFYYEPRLLGRIVDGEEFAPVPDLSTLNITQPSVKITNIKQTSPETVSVTVEVASVKSELQKDASGNPLTSGIYDIRLFRNGQLVGYTTSSEKFELYVNKQKTSINEERSAWRQAHRVNTDASERTTIVFDSIKVPQRADIKQVEFSAYGFNEDRVKSLADKKRFDIQSNGTMRKGRAFIITVGVNAFENPTFNLDFAANDARLTQEKMSNLLKASGRFDDVISLSLLSDYENRAGKPFVTERLATKDNFKRVLMALSKYGAKPLVATTPTSGTENKVESTTKKEVTRGSKNSPKKTPPAESQTPVVSTSISIPNIEKLQSATPDDTVLILFSSHGFKDVQGNFYLVPFDTGIGSKKEVSETVRTKSISSDELSLWMRDIDAGEILMIVDACYSSAAVMGKDFKPGPMGSRGLGQLSYDKGMRILAATQEDNVALESKKKKQGLLTYALIIDGLDSQKADFKPQDKSISIIEWLEYGVGRVPAIYGEEFGGTKDLEDEPANNSSGGNSTTPQNGSQTTPKKKGKIQQPTLFDFAKRFEETLLIRGQ